MTLENGAESSSSSDDSCAGCSEGCSDCDGRDTLRYVEKQTGRRERLPYDIRRGKYDWAAEGPAVNELATLNADREWQRYRDLVAQEFREHERTQRLAEIDEAPETEVPESDTVTLNTDQAERYRNLVAHVQAQWQADDQDVDYFGWDFMD